MRSFRALVVDNDAAVRRLARRTAERTPGLEIHTAETIEEADALIATQFFNVAFVDLQLVDGPTPTSEGLTILRLLDEVRPSCRALLLTKFFDVYRREIYSMLTPTRPLIDGAVDKTDASTRFATIVERDTAKWLSSPVAVDGLDALFERLPVRSIQTPRTLLGTVEITRDELDYVVSTLFGQALSREDDGSSDLDIESITLVSLAGGKSKSVVASGRPVNRSGQQGINCVVKIGPREDTLEELHRYDRYVRFRLSLHRRVEMLGHAVGDTIGAVCYSFAGKSPDDVIALQALFDEHDPRALSVIDHLLADAEDWQPDGERADDLAAFFDGEYGFDAVRIAKGISSFAEKHATTFGARRSGDSILFEGGKVVLPTAEDICEGHVLGDYAQGTVHGDLNASNVIVSNDEDITLIDFRHTTRGPVTLDLAALHASVRISPRTCEDVATSAVADHALEMKLWSHDFGESGEPWWPAQAAGPPPYWASVAAALMAAAAGMPEVSRAEHAATMLLYALRVVRVSGLTPAARMRLLVWISALKEVLSSIPEEVPA